MSFYWIKKREDIWYPIWFNLWTLYFKQEPISNKRAKHWKGEGRRRGKEKERDFIMKSCIMNIN